MKSKLDNSQRLPNGSIDSAFYAARAHDIRSNAAHRGIRSATSSISRFLDSLVAAFHSMKRTCPVLPRITRRYSL